MQRYAPWLAGMIATLSIAGSAATDPPRMEPSWRSTWGPPAAEAVSLTATPEGDTLVALDHGVWRLDAGSDWWQPSGLEGLEVRALLTTGEGAVLAGCRLPGGVWRSDDGGRTWSDHSQGLDEDGTGGYVAVETADGDVLISTPAGVYARGPADTAWRWTGDSRVPISMAAGAGSVVFAVAEWGLLRSEDGGETWGAVDIFTSDEFTARRVAADELGRVLVVGRDEWGLHSAVWASTDNGLTLDRTDENLGLDVADAARILPDGDFLVAGRSEYFFQPTGGVWRSTDLGATWSPAGHNTGEIVRMWLPGNGTVWMSTTSHLFRADAEELAWERPMDGLVRPRIISIAEADDGVLACGWELGVHQLRDGSRRWALLGLEHVLVRQALKTSTGEVLASSHLRLYSFDPAAGWETWNGLPAGVFNLVETRDARLCGRYPNTSSYDVACVSLDGSQDPCQHSFGDGDPHSIVAAGDGGILVTFGDPDPSDPSVLMRSTDGGCSWVEVRSFETKMCGLAADGEGRVALQDENQTVVVSQDYGATWENETDTGTTIYALVWDDTGRLFASTPEGVLVSDDLGLSWQSYGTGLDGVTAFSLVTHGGHLYAETRDHGVYRCPLHWPVYREPAMRPIAHHETSQ